MYFKRLEIFGFKSFAQKTVLEFQPGISAIVGPNGCGKSNVFDAIRWVLGEQSVKELRGSSMEDVIFNGTDQKAPLGFAEVSLTFSNESRVLPIDHDEVIVTRRLFRSGESEYLINKNVSRLKDIVELFLGTGVGAEAYSLIQQGKVDLVVSAKPDDRRQIFDEAAGITKYKSKKKEALSRLEDTQDNLLRVNDIVVEVKRQIATIERQAKKAQRYKQEFEVLKNYELIFARHQMTIFDQENENISSVVRLLQTQELELTAQLEELNNRIDNETLQLEEIDERINEFKAQDIHLENEAAMNTRQISFNEERQLNMDETCQRLQEDKAVALGRCGVHQAKIEEIKGSLSHLAENLSELQACVQQKRNDLSVLMHGIEQARASIGQVEKEILGLNGQQVRFKNQLTENMKRTMEALARKTRLELENSKVNDEKVQAYQRCEAINGSMSQVQAQLQELSAHRDTRRQALEENKSRFALQEALIDDLEKNHVFLISQKEFIQKMHLQYQDIPDPVVEGRFIATVRPSEKQTGIIGKIKDVKIIAATDQSPELYEITYETKYVELDLQYLDDRIAVINVKLTKALEVKSQLDQLIQEQGNVVEEVLKNIQEQEKKFSVLEAQKNDIELASGKLVGELDVITSEFAEVESLLSSLKGQETELLGNLQGIGSQITRCQEDIESKVQAIADKDQERQELNISIAQLDTELISLSDKRRGFEDNLALHTQNLDRDLMDINRFESETHELEAKKVRISEEIILLQQSIEELRCKRESLSVVLNEESAKKEEMSRRLNSLRNGIRGIEDEIIRMKTDMHNQQMRQQEVQFNQRSLKDRLLQAYKIDWDQIQNETSAQLLTQTRGQVQVIITENVSSSTLPGELVFDVEASEGTSPLPSEIPSNVEAAQGTQPNAEQVPSPQVNYEELIVEIERLKKRCESYGAVNLVAIEEFEELKGRYEFLTKQQSDLLTAREQLMSTIQKINRTTRQMFTDTFVKVNEEFKIYFRMLFGGGEAQLVLLDPDNALECGIDIVARPPGKKLQNISLLSGGEKTLTAIALIFGVFKVNPSPFCVLDEIDAALDESNVDRFAQLLKEFAKIAQFIVITHNKNTMSAADIMYGVTMQERGVSRIVSVKFNEYKPRLSQPHQAPPSTNTAYEENQPSTKSKQLGLLAIPAAV
ncbi:MAG: AAA family ATPase [Candidatus Omnitrophica bacterium]|nr:AAA family ATPase [Candidatus Omnitrophota bacterium]